VCNRCVCVCMRVCYEPHTCEKEAYKRAQGRHLESMSISSKQSCIPTKEPCISAKEPYMSTTEAYTRAQGRHFENTPPALCTHATTKKARQPLGPQKSPASQQKSQICLQRRPIRGHRAGTSQATHKRSAHKTTTKKARQRPVAPQDRPVAECWRGLQYVASWRAFSVRRGIIYLARKRANPFHRMP